MGSPSNSSSCFGEPRWSWAGCCLGRAKRTRGGRRGEGGLLPNVHISAVTEPGGNLSMLAAAPGPKWKSRLHAAAFRVNGNGLVGWVRRLLFIRMSDWDYESGAFIQIRVWDSLTFNVTDVPSPLQHFYTDVQPRWLDAHSSESLCWKGWLDRNDGLVCVYVGKPSSKGETEVTTLPARGLRTPIIWRYWFL